MADLRQNYGATSAPLTVGIARGLGRLRWRRGDSRIPGGVRSGHRQGGLALLDGPEAWGAEVGDLERHGHRARLRGTWLTGTYDPALDTLYWPTGNPCPDYDGSERLGDNLYSDSILALEPATGRLKWHFQYTPHDLWDWDAQQPPVLVDATWQGRPRQLLLHANRNGFFYVLDRATGALLLAKPIREAAHVGDGHRRGRTAHPRPRTRRRRRRGGGSVRRSRARPTGSRRRSTAPPASTSCRRSRSARCYARTGDLAGGTIVLRGRHAAGRGRAGPEGAPRDRHRGRDDSLGAPAGRPGDDLGRRARHRGRARLLRGGQRRARGGQSRPRRRRSGSSRRTSCGRRRR